MDDVAELMGYDRFQLRLVQLAHDPAGDRYQRVVGIATGRHRIRHRGIDDRDFGLGDARHLGQPGDDLVHLGSLLFGDLPGADREQDQLVAVVVLQAEQQDRDRDHEPQRHVERVEHAHENQVDDGEEEHGQEHPAGQSEIARELALHTAYIPLLDAI